MDFISYIHLILLISGQTFEVTVARGNFWELNMTSSHAHRPYLYLISFLYGFYPRLAGSTAANKKAASILDLLFYIISVVLYTRSCSATSVASMPIIAVRSLGSQAHLSKNKSMNKYSFEGIRSQTVSSTYIRLDMSHVNN